MGCNINCCPFPCRYRRSVVVATNTCSPCGGNAWGGWSGCGPVCNPCNTGALYPTFNPVYTGCGWGCSPGFGWGVRSGPIYPY